MKRSYDDSHDPRLRTLLIIALWVAGLAIAVGAYFAVQRGERLREEALARSVPKQELVLPPETEQVCVQSGKSGCTKYGPPLDWTLDRYLERCRAIQADISQRKVPRLVLSEAWAQYNLSSCSQWIGETGNETDNA